MPRVSKDVVIAGIGETTVGKLPGMSSLQIQAQAVHHALKDAGVSIKEVDGLINLDPYSTPNSMFSTTVADYLGIKASFCSTVDVGGTVSIMTMLQQAVWAIESGHCNIAVCVFGENMNTSRPPSSHGLVVNNLVGNEEWEEPFGVQGFVVPYALVAQRYKSEFEAQDTDFGSVAVVTRAHALLNPNAVMKKPMSMDDYLASRMISSPIRLLDSSLPVDGGGAIVLMSKDRARKMKARMVGIASMAMRQTHNSVAGIVNIANYGMRDAGRDAFESAGLGPQDMSLALLHDAYTVSVLITLEALGYAEPGAVGRYVKSGAASLGGRCPLNPHGGLLSQGHVGGMLHLVEAVRQLRHEAGARQVDNARYAVASGNGGIFSVCGVTIFERLQ
jgi:acetyl-CoA acetyltransferase